MAAGARSWASAPLFPVGGVGGGAAGAWAQAVAVAVPERGPRAPLGYSHGWREDDGCGNYYPSALDWEDGQSETRGPGGGRASSVSEYACPRSLYCRLQLDEGFFPLCRWRAQAPLAEVTLAEVACSALIGEVRSQLVRREAENVGQGGGPGGGLELGLYRTLGVSSSRVSGGGAVRSCLGRWGFRGTLG